MENVLKVLGMRIIPELSANGDVEYHRYIYVKNMVDKLSNGCEINTDLIFVISIGLDDYDIGAMYEIAPVYTHVPIDDLYVFNRYMSYDYDGYVDYEMIDLVQIDDSLEPNDAKEFNTNVFWENGNDMFVNMGLFKACDSSVCDEEINTVFLCEGRYLIRDCPIPFSFSHSFSNYKNTELMLTVQESGTCISISRQTSIYKMPDTASHTTEPEMIVYNGKIIK